MTVNKNEAVERPAAPVAKPAPVPTGSGSHDRLIVGMCMLLKRARVAMLCNAS